MSALPRMLLTTFVTATLVVTGASVDAVAGGPSSPVMLAQASLLHPAPMKPEESPQADGHPNGELDCRNCHQGKHQGVLRMYLGRGGRGTPPEPSHMSELRLECIACHVSAKEAGPTAAIVGQTWRPTDQACVGCHGDKYRGMITRWSDTLAKMRTSVATKLTAARAALLASPKHAKVTRARKLAGDAEFNLRFVELGRGVHNVYYAASLLRVANSWLDDAIVTLGEPAAKTEDALVRGGYCAVLCHEPAGVKLVETVKFGTRALPHVKHATEFGATCTTCHSAEKHKAFAATPATCTGCHHGPQNERCESCHRAQSAFYRGRMKLAGTEVAPNIMAEAVACSGCHDFAKTPVRAAVAPKCLGCHEPRYAALASEWTTGFDADMKKTSAAVRSAEAALARARDGQAKVAATALVKEAREAIAVVRSARPVHNPLAADGLLTNARRKAEEARAKLGAR